jgi:heme/copper-type cytochrome/quinol oxidase subunit 1
MFAIAFVPTFVMGGVTGVMLSVPPADFQFHDSYFVVAHFHYVIVGGILLGLFSGMFYWWPKMFGRYLNETLGKWFFWLFFIGFHMTFFVQHFLGVMGMPRRVYTYLGEEMNPGWTTLNFISSCGAILMTIAVILLLINVVITFRKPKGAPNDAWEYGRTMEWAIASPPPVYNFKQTPLVRGLDPYWIEKMEGKTEMTPAEPVQPIHMPSPSILPIIMSFGLFVAGIGFIYWQDIGSPWIGIAGLVLFFGTMVVRSLFDDPGYHLDPAEDEGV